MSTEEQEEEDEETKSESSIVVSSLGTIASTGTRLQIGLLIGTSIPIAITTGKKQKVIDFDDDYDTDIMSSDSYVKMIPAIKSGITAAEFAVKEVALKSVLAIRNCSEFFKESKHKSLPGQEDGGMNEDEEKQRW
jgi:hypothetical protein